MKNPHAVALGKAGGTAGRGKAKARTAEQCRAAAKKRWIKAEIKQIDAAMADLNYIPHPRDEDRLRELCAQLVELFENAQNQASRPRLVFSVPNDCGQPRAKPVGL